MTRSRLEVDFGVWGTVRKIAVTIFTLGFAVFLLALYVPTLRQSRSLMTAIESKKLALKQQQELQKRFAEEIVALKRDPEAVERAVRENLRLAKPDETIYHFEPSTGASTR